MTETHIPQPPQPRRPYESPSGTPAYEQQVAALSAENWSPTRVVGTHAFKMNHVGKEYARYEQQSGVAKMAMSQLVELENETGIPGATSMNEVDTQLGGRRRKEGLDSKEDEIYGAIRAWNNADIVAGSAIKSSDAALQGAELIKDAYLDVIRDHAAEEARLQGKSINPMTTNEQAEMLQKGVTSDTISGNAIINL